MNSNTRPLAVRHARRVATAIIAAGLVASAFSMAPRLEPAGARQQANMTVASTDEVVFVGRKLAPGAPLASVKPPYPEECGGGITGFGESTGIAPFSDFCDVVPLSVSLPPNIDPADDVRLSVELTWAINSPGHAQGAGPNLDIWLWDNRQNLDGKVPVPEFDGASTKWTPAEVLTEFTMLKAGTGNTRPVKMELDNPVLTKDDNGVNYNLIVMNAQPQTNAQPAGKCPVNDGPIGCYVVKAKMTVSRGQSRTERTEPTVPETPFTPPPVVTTVPQVTPPTADLEPVVGPLTPAQPIPVDFGATILPPPQASTKEDDTVVLGAVEAAVDPLLESIKSSDLDEELAAPQLEVAVSEEPPPIPPSSTAVAASMVALPVLAAGAVIVFLIRRRSTFRLT